MQQDKKLKSECGDDLFVYYKIVTRLLYLSFFIFNFSFLHAQSLKTFTDRTDILIGEQFQVKIEASIPADSFRVKWPAIPDSLPHFEVIERSRIDSIFENNKLSGLTQSFTITSFDSGKWLFPSFPVNLYPVNGNATVTLFTDSLLVIVSFSVADSTGQLRDIKPIKEVSVDNYLWYWIAGGIIILLVLFLLYRYFRKNKIPSPDKLKHSAYEEAMKQLDQLKQYNLSLPADIKMYHSRLAYIIKTYLGKKYPDNYLNKTTDEILISFNNTHSTKDVLSKLAVVLRTGDAVKFAKYIAPIHEGEENKELAREIINITERANVKS